MKKDLDLAILSGDNEGEKNEIGNYFTQTYPYVFQPKA